MFYYSNCISGVAYGCGSIIDLINSFPVAAPPPPVDTTLEDLKGTINYDDPNAYYDEISEKGYFAKFCSFWKNTNVISAIEEDDYKRIPTNITVRHLFRWDATTSRNICLGYSTEFADPGNFKIVGDFTVLIYSDCAYYDYWTEDAVRINCSYGRKYFSTKRGIISNPIPLLFLWFYSIEDRTIVALLENTENNLRICRYYYTQSNKNPVSAFKQLENPKIVLFHDTLLQGIGSATYSTTGKTLLADHAVDVTLNIDIGRVESIVSITPPECETYTYSVTLASKNKTQEAFLIYRVELKVFSRLNIITATALAVPNLPCGVERLLFYSMCYPSDCS